MKTVAYLVTILAVLSLLPGNGAADSHDSQGNRDSSSYTLAVVPFYSPEKMWLLYSPVVEYLRKSTGQPWELMLCHNHDEFVDAICDGRATAALAGPVPLGRAYHRCGARPFLVALDKHGKPSYRSVILTNESALTSLADLKGKKVGFFKGSTAAHIVPAKMLIDAGLSPSAIRPVFLDSQDRLISALLGGEIAAAGVKEALYQKFRKEGLHVVATSGKLPNFALCASPTVSPKSRERLMTALLSLKPSTHRHDAETVKNWDDEVKNGFIVPDNEFLPLALTLYTYFREVTNDRR